MLREIGYELLKMSSHKKSYIPIAGYILFFVLCYIAFRNSTGALASLLRGFELDRNAAAKYLDGFFFSRILLFPEPFFPENTEKIQKKYRKHLDI